MSYINPYRKICNYYQKIKFGIKTIKKSTLITNMENTNFLPANENQLSNGMYYDNVPKYNEIYNNSLNSYSDINSDSSNHTSSNSWMSYQGKSVKLVKSNEPWYNALESESEHQTRLMKIAESIQESVDKHFPVQSELSYTINYKYVIICILLILIVYKFYY